MQNQCLISVKTIQLYNTDRHSLWPRLIYTVYPSICHPAKPSVTEIDLLETPNNDNYVHWYLSLREPVIHNNEEEIVVSKWHQHQQAVHNGC